MWKDFELRTPRMTSQSVKSIRNHQFSFTAKQCSLVLWTVWPKKVGLEQMSRVSNSAIHHISVSVFREKKDQIQVDASSKSIQMPSYSSRNRELNSKTFPLAIPLTSAFKSRGDTGGGWWEAAPLNPCGHTGHSIPCTATHLTITEVDERNFLPACFDELGLE